MKNIKTLFVYLTANLPPFAQIKLKDHLYFTKSELVIVRINSSSFLFYIYLLLNHLRYYNLTNILCIKTVTMIRKNVCDENQKSLPRPITEYIFFLWPKLSRFLIQSQLSYFCFHSYLDYLHQDKIITEKSLDNDFSFLI